VCESKEEVSGKKKYVCKLCGYVHEADELEPDFTCPLCKRPASDFEEVK
jgi:rubrerythrin